MPAAIAPALPLDWEFVNKQIWSWVQATRFIAEPHQCLPQLLPACFFCPGHQWGQCCWAWRGWVVYTRWSQVSAYWYIHVSCTVTKKKICQNLVFWAGIWQGEFSCIKSQGYKTSGPEKGLIASKEWARWQQLLPEHGSKRPRDAGLCLLQVPQAACAGSHPSPWPGPFGAGQKELCPPRAPTESLPP